MCQPLTRHNIMLKSCRTANFLIRIQLLLNNDNMSDSASFEIDGSDEDPDYVLSDEESEEGDKSVDYSIDDKNVRIDSR